MNVSVSGLFLAGIVPGVLIGLFQMGLTYYYAVTRHYPKASEFSLRQLGRAAREAILAILTPVIIVAAWCSAS